MHTDTRHLDIRSLDDDTYVSLRTFRADGSPVDTPMWFATVEGGVVVRTPADSPKVRRLRSHHRVELRRCDWKGRLAAADHVLHGRATILEGGAAEAANEALHRRYGWKWNVVPMVPVPGVRSAEHGLSIRGRLRMMRHRSLWPTSVIVRIDPLR